MIIYKTGIKAYRRVLRIFLGHLWKTLILMAFLIATGIASLSYHTYQCIVNFTRNYPKTMLFIVCIIFVGQNVFLTTTFSLRIQKQNIRFDSLAREKDSIMMYSTYDSGYSHGMADGQRMLIYGHKQEKSADY